MGQLPWQLAIEEIFTSALAAPDVDKRDPYRHEGEKSLHSPDQNSSVRIRDYSSDGHNYRQELSMAAGTAAGQLIQGSDRNLAPASHISFADIILKVSNVLHLRTDNNNLLWNYVPFNPNMNPTFKMPAGLQTAQDAFAFAKASVPGADTLDSVQNTISDFKTNLKADGFADFSDPFHTYCTLTASKIPEWNYAAIIFMQLLFQGGQQLWVTPGIPGQPSPAGLPLQPTPRLTTLIPLIKQNYDTVFNAGVQGKVIGETLKSLLVGVVPGLSAIIK